jgi:hypothetical protein
VSLQEFSVIFEQLAHQALVGLPLHFIQKEAAYAFFSRIRDKEIRQHLLIGGERSLDKTLNQALRLEATKAAHGKGWRTLGITVARIQEQQCRRVSHLRRDCRQAYPHKEID